MESWAVRLFKFQWQKVRGKYLGPGFSLMSPQEDSKFWMKNNKNTAIFAILNEKQQKHSNNCYFKWETTKTQ